MKKMILAAFLLLTVVFPSLVLAEFESGYPTGYSDSFLPSPSYGSDSSASYTDYATGYPSGYTPDYSTPSYSYQYPTYDYQYPYGGYSYFPTNDYYYPYDSYSYYPYSGYSYYPYSGYYYPYDYYYSYPYYTLSNVCNLVSLSASSIVSANSVTVLGSVSGLTSTVFFDPFFITSTVPSVQVTLSNGQSALATVTGTTYSVTFSNLPAGTYTATVLANTIVDGFSCSKSTTTSFSISQAAPAQPPISFQGTQNIAVSPSSIAKTVSKDVTDSQSFVISNTGGSNLQINSITSSDSRVSIVSGLPITIAPSSTATFIAQTKTSSSFSATIFVSSNDPDTPLLQIPVSITVTSAETQLEVSSVRATGRLVCGERITASADLKNTGSSKIVASGRFKFSADNTEVISDEVSLEASQSKTVFADYTIPSDFKGSLRITVTPSVDGKIGTSSTEVFSIGCGVTAGTGLGELEVLIKDSQTGNFISGSVFISPGNEQRTTSIGRISFSLSSGTYTVTASSPDYFTSSQTVFVNPNQKSTVTIFLSRIQQPSPQPQPQVPTGQAATVVITPAVDLLVPALILLILLILLIFIFFLFFAGASRWEVSLPRRRQKGVPEHFHRAGEV